MRNSSHTKKFHNNNPVPVSLLDKLSPDDSKDLIRDVLIGMTQPQREGFIETLEAELGGTDIDIRAYLVPLGIPARSPQELTPIEVGHLVRFLMIIKPSAMPAVERAMEQFAAFAHAIRKRFGQKAA
jgi:hypothetical protein